MSAFNRLEAAALEAIVAAHPDHADGLLAQLRNAVVTARKNDGSGFQTEFTVDRASAPYLPFSRRPLVATVDVRGLLWPMEVTLFIRNGCLFQIGGQTASRDDTSAIDFDTVSFTVR